MRISGFIASDYRLPLIHPWESAAETLHQRRGWLMALRDEAGGTGYGDCAPLPGIGTETEAEARARIESLGDRLEGIDDAEMTSLLAGLSGFPAVRFGLETAWLDLKAKAEGRPLRTLLAPDAPAEIRTNAPPLSLRQLLRDGCRRLVDSGFDTLKVKLGLLPMAEELQLIRHLQPKLPEGIRLRLDANRSWRPDEAEAFVRGTRELPVEFLEEPLRVAQPEQLMRIQEMAPFDLALDESLPGLLQAFSPAELPTRRVILKPALLGGLLRCQAIARSAGEAGIRAVVTSALESAAGLWASVQLAAALDAELGPGVHGLSTGALFEYDLGEAPEREGGRLLLGQLPGSGFRINPAIGSGDASRSETLRESPPG